MYDFKSKSFRFDLRMLPSFVCGRHMQEISAMFQCCGISFVIAKGSHDLSCSAPCFCACPIHSMYLCLPDQFLKSALA